MKRTLFMAVLGFTLITAACHGKKQDKPIDPAPAVSVPSSGEISFFLNAEQQRSPLLKTIIVSWEPLEVSLEALGSIASDTDQTIQVRPPSSGHVSALLVTVGDQVRAGQPLVRYRAGGRDITLT